MINRGGAGIICVLPGFERAPRSIASKVLTGVWFMFVTVTLVTYTAGIVNSLYWASMTHKSSPTRPRYLDLAHVVNSKDIKYGTVASSQTYWYLMKVAVGEEFDIIRRHWQTVDGQAQLVFSVEEGLRRVRDGDYAFIMEGLMAKYIVNRRPCDLVTVGEQFGSRSYGFAVPKSMSWSQLDAFNTALLEMHEDGFIEALERRWFTSEGQCWNVTNLERVLADVISTVYVDKPRSVDVTTFTGPFVLFIVGVSISVVIALAEILYYRQHGRYQSNRAHGRQLRMDPDEGNI